MDPSLNNIKKTVLGYENVFELQIIAENEKVYISNW